MSKLNDLTTAEREHAGLVQHLEQLYATQTQDMHDLDAIHTQLHQEFTLPVGLSETSTSHVSSLSRAESQRQGIYAFPTPRKTRWARQLSLLAAVVVMTLVTGTFVSLLYLSHQHNTTTGSGGTPTVAPPVGNAEGETLAYMISANIGWLQDGKGNVKHTTDSGKTWQDVTPPSTILPDKELAGSLNAFSASSAWLMAGSSVTNSRATVIPTMAIISTTDGGRHWQKLSPILNDGTSIMPTNISFFSSQEGWGMIFGSDTKTRSASLIRTHNGGKSWSVTGSFPDASSGGGNGLLNFTSATNGWYANNSIRQGSNNLYHTHDAGKTWQPVTLPASSAPQTRSTFSIPRFFNASDGLLVKESSAPPGSKTPEGSITIYVTHNGGMSWVASQTVQGNEWSIQDANHWWVLEANFNNATQSPTKQITIHFTSDAGQHWLANAQPQFTSMDLIPCISNQCGSDATSWAVGYTGYPITAQQSHLYKTTDGGKTWFQIG